MDKEPIKIEMEHAEDILACIDVSWRLPAELKYTHDEDNIGSLVEISLKPDTNVFEHIWMEFEKPSWGEVLLSTNKKVWVEKLIVTFADLSYGTTSVYYKIVLENTEAMIDKLPDIDLEIV